MRMIYLGTPGFAVPSLDAVVAAGHEVIEVVTQPDRAKGRAHRLEPSPVKLRALAHGIPIYQPERIRRPEPVAHLKSLAPEVMVIVGYGQIIPQSIIDIPAHGIINVHASLLPRLRGAAPVQWSIVNGDAITGVTTMRIDAGLDTGDMLLKAATPIGPEETAVELGERLARLGADLLVRTLDRLGAIEPEKQDNALGTHAPILKKEDGLIDWRHSAQAIHNRVRGLQPWPGAFTTFRGQGFHIWRSRVSVHQTDAIPGRILSGKPIRVACGGASAIELLEVQIEGRKRMSAQSFANGQRLSDNESLGDAGI